MVLHVFSHNHVKIKVDSYNYLPLKQKSVLKSILDKDKNHYY